MSCYGEGERYIQERYRSLITDEYSLKQYARFLDVLLHVKMEPLFSQYYGRRQDRSRDGTFALRTGSAKGNNTKGLHAVESMS